MPRQIAPGLFHDAGPSLDRISASAIVGITRVRNEGWRLPFWLAYHRWLGVEHFIIVDNRSTDRTREILLEEPDVTLLRAPGPFQGPGGWRSWIGFILSVAPQRRWNLLLDADELFVVGPWRKGGLRDAARVLERDDVDVIPAVMVDCYPASLPIEGSALSAVPWQRAPWFDSGPYVKWRSRRRRLSPVYHGVRQRLFWPSWYWQRHIPKLLRKQFGISSPPSIIKAPFFKNAAARGVANHRSSHARARRGAYLSYVLHYKFDVDIVDKTLNAISEEQYYNKSMEYKLYYRRLETDSINFECDRSIRFTGYSSLLEARLCRTAGLPDLLEVGGTDIDSAWDEIRGFGNHHLTELSPPEIT